MEVAKLYELCNPRVACLSVYVHTGLCLNAWAKSGRIYTEKKKDSKEMPFYITHFSTIKS